jgi:hypothetical protein
MNVVPVHDVESGTIVSSFDLATGRTGGEVKPFKAVDGPDTQEETEERPEEDAEAEARAEKALEGRARRAAKAAGYYATKSRKGVGTLDNYGGFRIVDPNTNFPVDGFCFDMTAAEVIEWCAEGE